MTYCLYYVLTDLGRDPNYRKALYKKIYVFRNMCIFVICQSVPLHTPICLFLEDTRIYQGILSIIE